MCVLIKIVDELSCKWEEYPFRAEGENAAKTASLLPGTDHVELFVNPSPGRGRGGRTLWRATGRVCVLGKWEARRDSLMTVSR